MHLCQIGSRWWACLVAVATLAATLPVSTDAEARGGRAGFFIGGVVVGSVFAPRYVYPAPYYYYPPPAVVYQGYPANVTYVSPPVVVQQAAPVVPLPAPQSAAPARAQAMSIEDRLRRLRSICEQGLFTEDECRARREQILQEM